MPPPEPPPGEFALIDRYFVRPVSPAAGVVKGIGDDAAILQVSPGTELVAAIDSIVAGRHFPAGTAPRAIGHRALAVNLSDMAAMGAVPRWALLALTMPAADPDWIGEFSAGLHELAARHGVALVGGDTTGGPLTVSVQILGEVPAGAAMRRDGAKAGDLLVVTGTLGDAAAGLAIVQGRIAAPSAGAACELVARFEYPRPRVEFGIAARGIATAAMDLSDGLAGDLARLAAASGLAARIDVERLPASAALRSLALPAQARDWMIGGGDDYELLLAVPAGRLEALAAAAARLALPLTVIGDLHPGSGLVWTDGAGVIEVSVTGYDHFR